ncbi:probable pterin-4-alpha-carbinolamine dehydratase, chloroplastic [Selaginella moellendorffii]|uniref:probable pterin-4-alpha-carbinolamine dehydratase, chloroplastic n=1 Tax=Selaginella moellendorffii TaxID=88036 RepID=UPI000D1C3133|nr:probable pterin-4-alpha-carbinolamine dehydratase, chloroplastic [Selaginella moellendorffii]|eukprot:XP_024533261.1 probable pterin-4-alpha-carbinolamine dehydratase, chloroplastic [Selaginella moellendorffii]
MAMALLGVAMPSSSTSFQLPACGTRKVMLVRATAAGKDIELGARDPFPEELESKFGDKVLGNASTEHIILVPSRPVEIAQKSCAELPRGATAMTEKEAKEFLRKVVGWRIINEDGCLKLQGEWNLASFSAGVELFQRIAAVAKAENYFPSLSLDRKNRAKVDIWTESLGGLTENDFILAAKIDKLKTSDLIKRNRVWA